MIKQTMQLINTTNLIIIGKHTTPKIVEQVPHASQYNMASLKIEITHLHNTKFQILIYE
jgi:hypothetical protein